MLVSALLLALALLAGVPIAFAIMASALAYFVFDPIPDAIFVQRTVSGLQSFPLLAVPLFVLTGTAMARGGIAERLLGLADALVGHRRGGLAQVNVLNSVLMGGMSGSANADAAVDAKVLVPVMTRHGYGRGFASAISAASGVIAPILPPGIGLIIYGLLAQVSVGRLFMGGVVPALLMAGALMLAVRAVSTRRGYGADRDRRVPWRDVLKAAKGAIWALLMPVLLLVGLRIGVFTPTELGAIAAVYALVVGVVFYREIAVRDLPKVFREAVLATSVVLLIVGAAAALSAAVTVERIPQRLVELLLSVSSEPLVILLIINVALLALGTLLEGTSLLVLLTPILAPVATELGVDPVHFGVLVVVNLTIGGITPPVGTVMYTVCSITGSSVEEFSREIIPFLVALVAVLLLITYIPPLVTALPGLLMG